MKTYQIDRNQFQEKYNSLLQILFLLADTQNMFGEIGRGSGKTTEALAPRVLRVSYDMPQSTPVFAGATYVSLLENIIPGILTYLKKHYKRGIHFEAGKMPPKFFKDPFTEVINWKHTISFAWGTVIQLVSLDRPESALGKNAPHIFFDEMLRCPEDKMIDRIFPILRGDKEIHGHSPYFGGITGFSSTPNFENDHDWWLEYEKDVNPDVIKEIMYVAFRVKQATYKAKTTKSKTKQKQYQRFVNKWNNWLRLARKGETYYAKGSSFSNIMVLGLDYIERQYKGTKDFEKFKTSILGIRPKKVKNMFFGKFSKKNLFGDSYKYTQIDVVSIDGEFEKTSRDLKHCDPKKPIYAGYDPGQFMSIVFGQKRPGKMRILKNMYEIHPKQHSELALQINTFFKYHQKKEIYLHYDRAGNQKKYRSSSGDLTDTDAKILKRELERYDWTVHLMSLGKKTIYHWQHYLLLSILFGRENKNNDEILIDQNECEELVSSIYMSPLKKTEGRIELDKLSEKKLDLIDQAFWSTQIGTALMYLLFGEYEKCLPDNKEEFRDYSPATA